MIYLLKPNPSNKPHKEANVAPIVAGNRLALCLADTILLKVFPDYTAFLSETPLDITTTDDIAEPAIKNKLYISINIGVGRKKEKPLPLKVNYTSVARL